MKRKTLVKSIQNFLVAVAILMIWRGVWYFLDAIDIALFGGNHAATVIGGIIAGILILYLPDKDLKELGKL